MQPTYPRQEQSDLRSLVFMSRLSRTERQHLLLGSDAFPELGLREKMDRLVKELATDRLLRAENCLEVSRSILPLGQGELREEFLRTAITKAYYSIHHSLRSMSLLWNGWEADGHQESIDEIELLIKRDSEFKRISGLSSELMEGILEVRNFRSVADYSPYVFSRSDANSRDGKTDAPQKPWKTTWIRIKDDDWKYSLDFSIQIAAEILISGDRVWKQRI